MPLALIIEDDKDYADKLAKIMQEEGCSVEFAFDGEDAGTKLRENKYDLVLLDIVLPKKDGFMVLREMRSGENNNLVPVFLITNVDEPGSMREAGSLGGTIYFVKNKTSFDIMRDWVRNILAMG